MNDGKETKPMFTDAQRQIIASSLEVVIKLDQWLYCHYEDPERVRLGFGLTPEKTVNELVRRTRANDLEGIGDHELTMLRQAVLAVSAAGIDLGASHDDILATVGRIQDHRDKLAMQQDELERFGTVQTEHFRFSVDLATRARTDLAGLDREGLRILLNQYQHEPTTFFAGIQRHLAAVDRIERRSEEWIRRDRDTWGPGLRWNLYSEVQHDVCEAAALLECRDYPELPSQQRDRVRAVLLRLAPLIDWDLRAPLDETLGIATPPETTSST